MLELFALVVAGVALPVGLRYVVFVLAEIHRVRGVRRRAATAARGELVTMPALLRGVSTTYPGFWRWGHVDLGTAQWWPRSGWGIAVPLAGVRVVEQEHAEQEKYGLGMPVPVTTVLTCFDVDGRTLQLGLSDPTESRLVRLTLAEVPATGADPVRARLRWLRNRVPLPILVVLLGTLFGIGYVCLPLIGAHRVDGVVVSHPVGDDRCDVALSEPGRVVTAHGHVYCDYQQPGEHLPVWVMGWPHANAIDDPTDNLLLSAVLLGWVTVIVCAFVATIVNQRRKLRRLEQFFRRLFKYQSSFTPGTLGLLTPGVLSYLDGLGSAQVDDEAEPPG